MNVGPLLAALLALAMPSCENDTNAHCIYDGADLSPEAIDACLKNLGDKASNECKNYLTLIDACKAELQNNGICASAMQDGEAAPCLIQRTPKDKLSKECADALPAEEELKGLAKLWVEGKREIEPEEFQQLNKEDKNTYTRWMTKRKQKSKGKKGKQRDFAVREKKKSVTKAAVLASAKSAAEEAAAAGDGREQMKSKVELAARKQMAVELKNDKTGTLKEFTKAEMKEIVKTALKFGSKEEL